MKVKEQSKGEIGYKLERLYDLDRFYEHVTDDLRYVLLGEASHGTSEFYNWRIEITKRLITEHNFSFIAVEGDWPDCYKVNRYVKGKGRSETNGLKTAYDVLYSFNRWPTWMWANRGMVSFIEWLRHYNDNERHSDEEKVGFYGLDVYSLWESLEAVIKYLKRVDPSAVKKAVDAFQCFEPYAMSVEDYARAALFVPESCEDEVIGMLIELRNKASQYQANGIDKREDYFNAEQNAIVAKNAELYYRKMIQGGTTTWNIRDTHMMDTLKRLMKFHTIDRSKCTVWAHNTHVGDARHTDMADAKMINIGQLVREHTNDNKNKVWLVGFGTYKGTVIAAREWGEKMEIMQVPPAVEGSWDNIIHQQIDDDSNRLFIFKNNVTPIHKLTKNTKKENSETMTRTRTEKGPGQRAIGVVYNPEYERYGNYAPSVIDKRYDMYLHIDKTHAPEVKDKEIPETFPTDTRYKYK